MIPAFCERLKREQYYQIRAVLVKETVNPNGQTENHCVETDTCPIGIKKRCTGLVHREGMIIDPINEKASKK